jgi:NAD(P)-dependent dehydrogenase (short-subunit alcohol dehydrogenase family)
MATQGKVALITGCSSGVGAELAAQLMREGAKVYATLRNPSKADHLRQLISGSATGSCTILQLDVQDESSVSRAVEQVLRESGRLDFLVNNAGFGSVRTLEQASWAQIHEIMDVNFYGALRCIRAVLPAMRAQKSGHIVSISSVGGLVGQPLNEIYCAAKFALEGLVESLATYLEPYFGIRMSLVEPAGIKTEFVNRVLTDLQREKAPLQEVYGPVLNHYIAQAQKRGAFDNSAQTPAQVAEVVVNLLKTERAPLRTQTSPAAKVFAAEKLQADPTGEILQKRIRRDLLGMD